MIRFYNGRLLSMSGGTEISADEVWTEGGKIAYVGPERADAPQFSREIDLRGDLLMPGFKNAHAHSAMTFLRSHADDLPLQSWLFEQVFPFEARLGDESVRAFTQLAILEYLSGGITAAFDMYYHREAFAQACIDAGFRSVLCGGLTAGDDFGVAERDFAQFNSLHPLISYRLGFHGEYTADLNLIEHISRLAHEYRAPVFMHNSETAAEVEACILRHGMSPTRLFDSMGIYDFGGGGFHCVWFDEEDIEIFRRRGLVAVTNPASNSKLASGIAPLGKFAQAGVEIALGTDGAGSNNALDMFREMYLACVLQKLQEADAAACPADGILRAATLGGAHAMGLYDCDCIAEGKQADLIVIDLQQPNMRPLHNIAKNLVYSGGKQNVRLTMIAGRVLYEDGRYDCGLDPERVYAEAETLSKEIFA